MDSSDRAGTLRLPLKGGDKQNPLSDKWCYYVSMARRPRQVFAKERDAIRSRGGMVRMSDALRIGISRKTFYAMRDAGVLEQLSRGLFRLRDLPPLGNPDLVTVAKPHPRPVLKVGRARRRLSWKARHSGAGMARPAQPTRRLGHRGDRLLRYLWHGHPRVPARASRHPDHTALLDRRESSTGPRP